MSNYHILESNSKLSSVHAVFHIDVPNEKNAVNIDLRTALKYRLMRKVNFSVIPNLEIDSPDEYSKIINGEIYEKSVKFKFSNAHSSVSIKRDELDAQYVEYTVSIVEYLQKILKYYKLNRNVT